MPLDDLKRSPRVVGAKQVRKALTRGIVNKVYIAGDAEPHVVEPIKQLCHKHQVGFEMVNSMETLGEACGIDVGSATVALLDNMGKEVQ